MRRFAIRTAWGFHRVSLEKPAYDAILVVGFGGPEQPADVMPFLENVLRGRNVPAERMREVASHYEHFDGKSPLNDQMRDLIARLRPELEAHGIHLPIFWGNRNWHPLLPDTLRDMAAAGVRRALAWVASGYSSYSGCRQYLQDLERARAAVGPGAPQVAKLRVFYNHPSFIATSSARLQAACEQLPPDRRGSAHLAFTAHSIPSSMAATCAYEQQLLETCRLTSEQAGAAPDSWQLVYQSRSGRPQDPWLGPDILDHLRSIAAQGTSDVVVMPIGFLSDHIEVLYDLDFEAQNLAQELNLNMIRAATVGTHPLFVGMIRELIAERLSGTPAHPAIGANPAWPDDCPADCCPAPRTPPLSKGGSGGGG
ncbi:MAG: ferrochelatase [Planctomycetia bacterium]|nr:ferrochelatase [Planctomycetia bacterium]